MPPNRHLPHRYPAHDVRDLEALVRQAIGDELRTRRRRLPPDAYHEAVGHFLGVAWELSSRYDPDRARPHPTSGQRTNFYSWGYRILRLRLRDWLEQRHLDHSILLDDPSLDPRRQLRLDSPRQPGEMDPPPDRRTPQRRVDHPRTRRPLPGHPPPDPPATRRAA